MADNTSSSLPIKILWQTVLVVGLILGVWVLGRTLPLETWIPQLAKVPSAHVTPAKLVTAPTPIDFYSLPRTNKTSPSALDAIALKISTAQVEVIVATRSMSARLLWTALFERAKAGVVVSTLLSPEGTTNFATGKLAEWLREQKLTTVYKDIISSSSNIIVIDQKIVILSDLPFSQRAFDPTEAEAASGSSLGFATIIESPALAKEVATALRSRLSPANKLL